MTDKTADTQLLDRMHLLKKVQYRVALAFFAVANRNLPLFNALKKHVVTEGTSESLMEQAKEACF